MELDAEPTPPISGQFAYVAVGESIHAYTHASGDEVWAQSLPGPAVRLLESGDLLHVVSHEPDESGALFGRKLTITAFDPETGGQEWQSEIGKQRIFATDTDHLYVNSTTDVANMPVTISALDADDGTQIWNRKLKSPSQVRRRQQRLYIANDDGIYGFDSEDGTTKWHFEWSEFGYNSFAVGPDTVAGVEGSMPYLTLHVLGRDGEHRWSFDEWPTAGLTLFEGTLFTGGERIAAFDADTGEIAWDREYSRSFYDAPIIGEAIVSGGSLVQAFDLSDGSEHWSFDAEFADLSPVTVHDETIYVLSSETPGADDRGVIGLEETSGEEQWRLESESALTEVGGGNNGVYVCEESGVLYALS